MTATPTLTLARWMQDNGLDDEALAALARRDRSNIGRLRRGEISPSWELAAILVVISDGRLQPTIWLPPAPKWAKPLKRTAA